MNYKMLKSLWVLSILVCAGCTLKDAADCAPGQTQCKNTKDGTGVYNVCSDDAEYVMKTTCMLGCGDNDMCRSLNACDKDEQLCRGIEGGLALVWTCKNQQASITPCTGVCDGNACHDGGSQGMCLGTEKPFCAQTVAVWCENNYWQAQSCDEASEDCIEGKCVSRIQPVDTGEDPEDTGEDPDDAGKDPVDTGEDPVEDDTCKDDVIDESIQSSKVENDEFHIYTGKGFLDYQALAKEDRKLLKKIVIHGNINLNHAGKTVMSDDETACSWSDWKPLAVDSVTEITGVDNATIEYHKCNMRCTLPNALFDSVSSGTIKDLSLDYDYSYNQETGGILVKEIRRTSVENIHYKGDVSGGNSFFGLISNAGDCNIKGVRAEYGSLKLISGYSGGLLGALEGPCEISDVQVVAKDVFAEREFGGIIGSIYDNSGKYDVKISHSSVILDAVVRHGWYEVFGGVIAYNQSGYNISVSDVYVQLGKVSAVGEYISSAVIGGVFFNEAGKYELSNIVANFTDESGITLSGFIGNYIGGTGEINIHDSVVISAAKLVGSVGKVGVSPRLNRVVMVTPASECDKVLYSSIVYENVTWDASKVVDSYYYEIPDCDNTSYGIKTYSTGEEAEGIVSLYKSLGSGLDWQVKNYKLGDKMISVPVFTAAGILAK